VDTRTSLNRTKSAHVNVFPPPYAHRVLGLSCVMSRNGGVNSKIITVFHLVTQVDTSIVLCYLLNAKKDRTMFVSTCITKWKIPKVVLPIDWKHDWLNPQVRTNHVRLASRLAVLLAWTCSRLQQLIRDSSSALVRGGRGTRVCIFSLLTRFSWKILGILKQVIFG